MLSNIKPSLLTITSFIKGIILISAFLLASGCQSLNEAKEQAVRDQLIVRHIKHALYKNDAVPKSGHFSVTAQKGIVTLGGIADSQAQKEDAIAIAKRTQGVEKVESEIILKGSSEYYSFINKTE